MQEPKVLLVENIHPVAKERLESEGFRVDTLTYAPEEAELAQLVQKYDVIGIRSKTQFTRKVLEQSSPLALIGAFCIGTNQIDLEIANAMGVPVFNAPHSNTRSVAELVIADVIGLSRQLVDRSQLAHKGEWMKSAEGSREV